VGASLSDQLTVVPHPIPRPRGSFSRAIIPSR
jgi:hypothetical protein